MRNKEIEISIVMTNNADAYVLVRADSFEIPTHVFTRSDMGNPLKVLKLLQNLKIDFIVLAGFLWLLPIAVLKEFNKRIVNVHPALLPKFGGAGMYGSKVHQAVLDSKEKESGITIHYVNENYDEGEIIFQASCPVSSNDTLENLMYKIQQLEYQHYPRIIESLIKKM